VSDAIISVEQLSKRYLIGANRASRDGLRHSVERAIRNPLGWFKAERKRRSEERSHEFWALKDVSFEIKHGEVVGIIGRNGAGKSTLLKILSRITEPTLGRIRISGRVASLLEVGTGFHQELTGRENIFLNGAILGMSKVEIKRKFDEIVAFSEIETFLDTPVKRYSSGMYVRLAFAVAAHLEPDTLVVDEVLAVGDAEFQQKCLGKMQQVSRAGRTVLFVSHQLGAVRQLCQRALLITKGRLVLDDLPGRVIENYLSQTVEGIRGGIFVRSEGKPSNRVFFVNNVILSRASSEDACADFESDENVVIRVAYTADRVVKGLYGYITLQRSDGTLVYEGDSFDTIPNPFESMRPGEGNFTITIPMRHLAPGKYHIYLSFASSQDSAGFEIDVPGVVGEFQLSDNTSHRGNRRQGFLSSQFDWRLLNGYVKA
jgi:lipopolysaccharide transport system ATP-binding protein